MDEELDPQLIIKQTPGYVAADLKALLTEAGVIAVQRLIDQYPSPHSPSIKDTHLQQPISIHQQDLQQALQVVQPTATREGFTICSNINFD